jgi:hypothetical protein
MDNSVYGIAEARADDPDHELSRALHEVRRVTAPGGTVLVTLPYGQSEDHGWFRQFDREGIDRLLKAIGAPLVDVAVYAYGEHGWQVSDLDAAAGRRYGEGVTAASAVACLRMRWGSGGT